MITELNRSTDLHLKLNILSNKIQHQLLGKINANDWPFLLGPKLGEYLGYSLPYYIKIIQ